ncbi:hypothetical protein HS960_19775 [Sphingobacterium paramultivorum]|uniref:Uncharacterized protein n=1 Tax=Sphingobacterium paramultivorum TaxID=2886510 RepID=A0A7G5E6X7_9SPHI|nr:MULTISPECIES: hypothetical protein [Sphingobacterium]MCS4166261.1 hypothetical protein [Sphingobacterium sp. BIGb0116]QMV69752.1 hypothetical protein HS960_19775 [Sphingobacterium paramultivorum]WSO13576.1 hypothetical protein VUL84_19775 [Sphingobacterium paramultivorum]
MKAIYEDLLHLDRPFYEIHEDSYDPLKCIESFWGNYPLATIRENLYALDLKCKTLGTTSESKLEAVQQSLFLADILRTLIAYFLMHSRHIDTTQIKLSTLDLNMEEIRLTKKINDFFQSINQPKP